MTCDPVKTVAVIGLGKLGAPMAALFASAGYRVMAADRNPEVVAMVNRGEAPVQETGLQALFDRHAKRITAATDAASVAFYSDLVFIIVPTPSRADDTFSHDLVREALESIVPALRSGARPTIVITSTLSPGTMDEVIVPELEAATGLKCGVDLQLAYNPEFIALGSVLADMTSPSFILIGEQQPGGAERLHQFYREIYVKLGQPVPPSARLSFVDAEMAKLAINCFCTMKISFANAISALCERLPGADALAVCRAIGLDRRIGRAYIKPGTAYAGPCFPRDCRAMIAVGPMPLAHATDEINRDQPHRLFRRVFEVAPRKVVILGLTYKTNTHVTEESAGLKLTHLVRPVPGVELFVHDPVAAHADNWKAKLREADVAVITVEWELYRNLTPADFKPGSRIIDCWGVLDEGQFAGHDLVVPGRGVAR